MSWSAHLGYPGNEYSATVVSEGYTHNTSVMIYAVLTEAGVPDEPSWWKRLDLLNGAEGSAYLTLILNGLLADPERFRAMNPPNGWGNYDDLVATLSRMRDASVEHPAAAWSASG
jgi:hypothetical protein